MDADEQVIITGFSKLSIKLTSMYSTTVVKYSNGMDTKHTEKDNFILETKTSVDPYLSGIMRDVKVEV